MNDTLVLFVAIPVGVRLLHHDAALEEQALDDLRDVELRILRLAHSDGQVFEVTKHGHRLGSILRGAHGQMLRGWQGAVNRRLLPLLAAVCDLWQKEWPIGMLVV